MQPTAAPERSDKELVESYQRSRQREDLDVLLRRHVGRLRRMISAMVLNQSDADDLTQEVLLRAIRGLPQFDGQAKFSTWLYSVAANTTYGFLRRRACSPVDGTASPPEPVADCADQPDRSALRTEMHEEITAAMAELSPSLRAAMVLTVLEGLPAEEAAEIEQCSRGTMYWRVHQARKILNYRLARYLSP
jgi:RNA polymerase sigma-70 factor (ECF subfamily)